MIAADQSVKVDASAYTETRVECPCGAPLDEDEKLLEDGLCCACWLKKYREG
jgi:hypothetical protein